MKKKVGRKILESIHYKIFFLCDGEVPNCEKNHCYQNGEDGWCRWTSDIRHAKNFKKKECGSSITFSEQECNINTLRTQCSRKEKDWSLKDEEVRKMKKAYSIEKLYADTGDASDDIPEIVEAELKICLKGNEWNEFRSQPFYLELIQYLDSLRESEKISDAKIQNKGNENLWKSEKSENSGNNKEAKVIKIRLHGYKKILKKIRKIKREITQLNKATKEFAELKEKLF